MRLTISKKVNTITLGLQLLGFGTTVFLASQLLTDNLSSTIEKHASQNARILASRTVSEIRNISQRAISLMETSHSVFSTEAAKEKFLQSQLSFSESILSLTYFERDNKNGVEGDFRPVSTFISARVDSDFKLPLSDFKTLERRAAPNFSALLQGKPQFLLQMAPNSRPILRLFVPIADEKGGKFNKVVSISIFQEKFFSYLSETEYAIFLTDDTGTVLASTQPKLAALSSSISGSKLFTHRKTSQQPEGQINYVDSTGTDMIAAYKDVKAGASLVLIAQAPKAEVVRAVSKMNKVITYLSSFFLFIALGLGFLFSLNITRPIESLANAAEKVKNGDFSVRLITRKQGRLIKGDEIQQFSGIFNDMLQGLQERDKLKTTFTKFHSKEVAEKMLSGELKLGGERKNAIVFFSDIRGFTSLSERIEAEHLVHILNQYMTRMVKVVNNYGGVVDKYIGDAIMALWGFPLSKPDDAERAVRACLAMRQELSNFNHDLKRQGYAPIRIGMGLNFGPVVMGNIGSDERMEFTVIGDTVNTASRIESLTKELGTDLLISQSVAQLVNGKFVLEAAQKSFVKGKHESVSAYLVHGYYDQSRRPVIIKTIYSQGVTAEAPNSRSTSELTLNSETQEIPKPITAPIPTTKLPPKLIIKKASPSRQRRTSTQSSDFDPEPTTLTQMIIPPNTPQNLTLISPAQNFDPEIQDYSDNLSPTLKPEIEKLQTEAPLEEHEPILNPAPSSVGKVTLPPSRNKPQVLAQPPVEQPKVHEIPQELETVLEPVEPYRPYRNSVNAKSKSGLSAAPQLPTSKLTAVPSAPPIEEAPLTDTQLMTTLETPATTKQEQVQETETIDPLDLMPVLVEEATLTDTVIPTSSRKKAA